MIIVGFLTGAYIPMGVLPEAVQNVIRVFPVSHAAVLFRRVMVNEAIALQDVPGDIRAFLGIEFRYGSFVMPAWGHVVILVATALVFYGLSILVMSRRRRRG